jgi:hypothetical protein
MSLFLFSIYKLPFILSWSLYSSTLFLHCTAMFALFLPYPLPWDVGLNLSECSFFWLVFWFTFSVGDGDFCCLLSFSFSTFPACSFLYLSSFDNMNNALLSSSYVALQGLYPSLNREVIPWRFVLSYAAFIIWFFSGFYCLLTLLSFFHLLF